MSDETSETLPEDGYAPHPDCMMRDLGGESVLVSLETGRYFGLDDIGTAVWGWMQEHGALAPIVEKLVETYDVDTDTARADLEALVREMMAAGLLVVNQD